MKTLADLKRNAHKYEWSMERNSWFTALESRLTEFRKVAETTTKQIGFHTWKYTLDGKDKINIVSWLDWPKASELTIKHFGLSVYEIRIDRKIPADKNMGREESIHTLIYKLRPIYELFVA